MEYSFLATIISELSENLYPRCIAFLRKSIAILTITSFSDISLSNSRGSLSSAGITLLQYIPFAPHNPSGPVANAATLQLAACCPNFSILEIMYSDVEWRKDVTDEKLEYKDGYITIPEKPGLGIEINEEECLKHPYVPHTLRHYTGALTDIRPAKTEFYF